MPFTKSATTTVKISWDSHEAGAIRKYEYLLQNIYQIIELPGLHTLTHKTMNFSDINDVIVQILAGSFIVTNINILKCRV